MKTIQATLGKALIIVAFATAPSMSCLADLASAQPSASPHSTANPDEIGGAGSPAVSSTTPAPNTKARETTQAKAPAVTLSLHDSTFIKQSQMRILFETQIGQLAQTSASSPEVRKFGETVVAQNSTIGDRLKVVAMSQNLNAPIKLDTDHQARFDALAKVKGKAFDRAYSDQMLHTSERALMALKKAQTKASNEDLKTYVVETTPVIEKRWRGARELEKSVVME